MQDYLDGSNVITGVLITGKQTGGLRKSVNQNLSLSPV